jgi:translocation and assembly module TamB
VDSKKIVSRLGKTGLWSIAALLLLVGALAWLAGTEPALNWAARYAETLSAGKLTARGVHGSLYGPLRIEQLDYRTEEKHYALKEAHLDWSPVALLQRRILVSELSLQELQVVELKPSKEPPKLPATLRLPLSLSIPSARANRIVLKSGSSEHVLSGLAISIEKPTDTYRLALSGIITPWGVGQGEVSLAEAPPFAIAGHASISQQRGWAYEMKASVSGTLPHLILKATASSKGGHADADAILTPFEKRSLAEARIDARDINPAQVRTGMPQGAISAHVTVRSEGEEAFAGEISMGNAMPGPWDKARLPVHALSARFAGTPEQVELSTIGIDLGKGGRFDGKGQVKGGRLELALTTDGFDPHDVHSKLRSMRLGGSLNLDADSQAQNLTADLGYQQYRLQADAVHHDGIVELRQGMVRSRGGSLSLFGTLALAEPRKFQLSGGLEGFDPSAFGDFPSAYVNASFTSRGQLLPDPAGELRFAIADSRFRRQPLSGKGGLNLSAKRIWDANVEFQLARNRLEAHGSLGAAGDRLAFKLDAGNLAAFGPEFAGRANAAGSLEGSFTALSGAFNLDAGDLRWRNDYRVASLTAKGAMEKGMDGKLELNARAVNVITPQIRLDRASLAASGQRMKHTLQLAANNPDFDLEGSFAGGWQDESGWSGQVLKLVNRGRHPFALKAPARLEVAPAHFRLANADFDLAGGNLRVGEASYEAGQLSSRGEFNGMPAAYLQKFAGQPLDLKTDLSLGGEWQIKAQDRVNGHIALRRERGDVVLLAMPDIALGLSRLALNVDVMDNKLQGRLEAAGTQLGSLDVEMQSLLSQRDGRWGIAGDAPLHGAANLAVSSIAWATPLIDKTQTLILDGALKGQVNVSGTFGQPALTGALEGERFQVRLPDQGLNFHDGRFLAELQGETLLLKNLSLLGGQGNLTGQGQLALKGGEPDMRVSLKADKLEVLSRPDRHLILSGGGEASVSERKVMIAANLKADRGVIELPKSGAPTPSEDVVVLGREEAAARKGLPYAVRLDLDLDMGENFYFRGRGLDAQLGGTVKLASVNGALPKATGSIRVVKGSYFAYGQRLEIERGILNFQGPLDNPGLNIVAMRKNQQVEAGVAVTGSAQTPVVKLVSDPDVPDSEKLSWLVLGHGIEDSKGQDFSVLQAAAGALLAAGESVTLQQRIAHAAGLEEISLKGAGTLESTVLTLGKRLSSRAYLSYEQGLSATDTLVKINYALTKRLSVQGQAGTTPAVDLFYTFSFD